MINLLEDIGIKNAGYTLRQRERQIGCNVDIEIPYEAGNIPLYTPQQKIPVRIQRRRIPLIIDRCQYNVTANDYTLTLSCHSEEAELATKAYTKDIVFMSLTPDEIKELTAEREKLKKKPDLCLVKRAEDEFGRGGWTSNEIIKVIAGWLGLRVINNVFSYQVKQIRIPEGVPYIDTIIDLVSVFNPHIYLDGSTLFILDSKTRRGGTVSINKALQISESYDYNRKPPKVVIEGYEGEFIPAKSPYKTYEDDYKKVLINFYGLRFYIETYGNLITETAISTSHENYNDIKAGDVFTTNYEIKKYFRNVYGEKGELVYSRTVRYRWRKTYIDVPLIQDIPAFIKDYWEIIANHIPWVGTVTQERFILEDCVNEEEVHIWHFVHHQFEKPRQDSCIATSPDFSGRYQPVIVKVIGQYCYFTSHNSEILGAKHYIPLARVSFIYKFWTDSYLGKDKQGKLFYEEEDVFGPISIIEADNYDEEDEERVFLRYQPLCETKETEMAPSYNLLPEYPEACTDIKALFSEIYGIKGFIEIKTKRYVEMPDSEAHREIIQVKKVGKDKQFELTESQDNLIYSPIPASPIKRRTMQIVVEDEIPDATIDCPPQKHNLQIIDWVDARNIHRYCKQNLSRGKLTREYVLPVAIPVDMGWGVRLNAINAPGGKILNDRNAFRGFISQYTISHYGIEQETRLTVEGEIE